MERLIAVALGGLVGALARYSVYLFVDRYLPSEAPAATWTVNLVGCFLIGFLVPFLSTDSIPVSWRLFLLVGFLGSFTTFSTFSLESIVLWENGRHGLVLLNMLGSVAFGVALVWAGMQLHRVLMSNG